MSERSCPCYWTTPCMERCTCANPSHSGGCLRCCSYGDAEERGKAAELIIKAEGLQTRLRAALRQANERGWGNVHISSTRGDCNCPHPVSYHPRDGHGFEEFEDVLELDSSGATLESEWERPHPVVSRDPVRALCDLLESMPAIKDRPLIERTGGA